MVLSLGPPYRRLLTADSRFLIGLFTCFTMHGGIPAVGAGAPARAGAAPGRVRWSPTILCREPAPIWARRRPPDIWRGGVAGGGWWVRGGPRGIKREPPRGQAGGRTFPGGSYRGSWSVEPRGGT